MIGVRGPPGRAEAQTVRSTTSEVSATRAATPHPGPAREVTIPATPTSHYPAIAPGTTRSWLRRRGPSPPGGSSGRRVRVHYQRGNACDQLCELRFDFTALGGVWHAVPLRAQWSFVRRVALQSARSSAGTALRQGPCFRFRSDRHSRSVRGSNRAVLQHPST